MNRTLRVAGTNDVFLKFYVGCICFRYHFEREVYYLFDIHRTVHHDILLQQKPTRCTTSQIYFDKELYMFRTDLLSIIRSLNTVFTATGICNTSYVDCLLAGSGSRPR
jgi:hypothetical protein